MANDRVTIALDGDIPFQVFAQAMVEFNKLIAGVAAELVQAPVDWLVEELSYGSAIATARGFSADVADVERAVRGTEMVFSAIGSGQPIPFDQKRVAGPAQSLANMVGGRVISLNFYTSEDFRATVQGTGMRIRPLPMYDQAYGRIEGTVENLYRRTTRFMMIDNVYKRPVSCHLAKGNEEDMRGIWNGQAMVAGLITRERNTGRPVMVDNITDIQVIPPVRRGQFKIARGALNSTPSDPTSLDLVRRSRDGT